MKSVLIEDGFFSRAADLRKHFEKNFKDPRENHSQRFVWDYWHVPGQYRLIRTPAYFYFPKKTYQDFHSYLVQWGRENLGCHDISPPWLSYYTEGCRQELHADVPHGPWAFVYSLSPKRIRFTGGETLILKDEVLNYWTRFSAERQQEKNSFTERITPNFNRLVVFDPRVPHGVSEVEGVIDPMNARLVIHGWFVKPRPYVVGGLTVGAVEKVLSGLLMDSQPYFQQMGAVHGTVSIRFFVSAAGQVRSAKILTNTVQGLENPFEQRRYFHSWLKAFNKSLRFPAAKGPSKVTLPLLFE
jgi:hypothetical protein